MDRRTGLPEIVSRYLVQHPWIEMVRMPQRRDRSFAAKVQAFNAGYERVKDLQYEIIGNLDADISFEPDHFEFLAQEILGRPNPRRGRNGFQRGRLQFGARQLRGRIRMFRGSASCSGGNAGRKSAVISHTALAESTGWQSRPPG